MGAFLYLQKSLEPDQKMKKQITFELKWEAQDKNMEPTKWVPVRCSEYISAGAAKGVILIDLAFSYRQATHFTVCFLWGSFDCVTRPETGFVGRRRWD